MARAAFLYRDYGAGILRTGTTPATGLGFANLNDPQPRVRTRFSATSANFTVDLGSPQYVDCAALIGLSNVSSARLQAGSTSGGTGLADSGVETVNTGEYAVWCTNSAVSARYWRWDITGTNPMDVGLAPLGLLWRPERNYQYGGEEGYIDLGAREMNPDTGAVFTLALQRLRRRLITFPAMTANEASGYGSLLADMERTVGAAGDCLFVDDPAASWTTRGKNSIWGAFRQPGGGAMTVRTGFANWSRTFEIVERL